MTTTTTTTPVYRSISYLDPAMLVVGANVRLDPRLDKGLVDSIRERGVLEPIVAYVSETADDGRATQYTVLYGQRRTLAAVQAKRDKVGVLVVPKPAEADRVVDQLAENDHRTGLTTAERIAAFEQLAAFGLPAGQIARRTATDRAVVDAHLAVAGSAIAKGAAERWDFLTLDQAAAVAEFDDDDKAVKDLVTAANAGGFDHTVQRLRRERRNAEAKQQLLDNLATAGIPVINEPTWAGKARRLNIINQDGERITAEQHAACPGHAAYLYQAWSNAEGYEWVAEYACTDPKANGHDLDNAAPRPGSGPGASASAEDRSAAEAAAAARIAADQAWIDAEKVRRDWLRTFLTRKTPPKDAARFVAEAMIRDHESIGDGLFEDNQLARQLFGAPEPDLHDEDGQRMVEAVLTNATANRAMVVTLGLVLCALEERTSCLDHRDPDPTTPVARYLRYLAAQGYELSDIERTACGDDQATEPDRD